MIISNHAALAFLCASLMWIPGQPFPMVAAQTHPTVVVFASRSLLHADPMNPMNLCERWWCRDLPDISWIPTNSDVIRLDARPWQIARDSANGDTNGDAQRKLQRGALLRWTLGDKPIGDMVVTGDVGIGPFRADTEVHRFDRRTRFMMAGADFDRTPLRLSPVKVLEHLGPTDSRQGLVFATPRTFMTAPVVKSLASDPGNEKYLFHLQSGREGSKLRVDHFLLIEFRGRDPRPVVRWFVDAGSYQRLEHLHPYPSHPDWEVQPIGAGHLTPIESAQGHEMVPVRWSEDLSPTRSRLPIELPAVVIPWSPRSSPLR